MNLETIFSIANLLTLPFWFILIFLPWWGVSRTIMRSPYVAIFPTLAYIMLVVPSLGSILSQVSNPELTSIAALLGTPEGAAIAWAHFLAFDLLVGRWVYLDSVERGIPWFVVAPLQFFVLMLGPFGFGLYLLVRAGFSVMRGQPAAAVLDPAPVVPAKA